MYSRTLCVCVFLYARACLVLLPAACAWLGCCARAASQCNICRLHGKVGALGVATALSVLLGAEGRGGDSSRLHRVEVAALISTLGKFANAVQIVQEFEARRAAKDASPDAGAAAASVPAAPTQPAVAA